MAYNVKMDDSFKIQYLAIMGDLEKMDKLIQSQKKAKEKMSYNGIPELKIINT